LTEKQVSDQTKVEIRSYVLWEPRATWTQKAYSARMGTQWL